MTRIDLITGLYALGSAYFNFLNVVVLLKHKTFKGVHWSPPLFFASLGIWNLYAYPNLGLWFSFVCGFFVVASNLLWAALALYYFRKEKNVSPKNDVSDTNHDPWSVCETSSALYYSDYIWLEKSRREFLLDTG